MALDSESQQDHLIFPNLSQMLPSISPFYFRNRVFKIAWLTSNLVLIHAEANSRFLLSRVLKAFFWLMFKEK